MTVLTFQDLELARGGETVLRCEQLSVDGPFIALTGPNGSGKTTLMLAICGLLPKRGEVQLNGSPISRSDIGFAPQSIRWPRGFTQLDVCRMAAWLRGAEPRHLTQIANEGLALAGAEEVDRPVHKLSGGQLRTLTLAQAICPVPRLLVLDEPTAEADVWHRQHTARTLESLTGRTTILASTHVTEDLVAWRPTVLSTRTGKLEQVLLQEAWEQPDAEQKLRASLGLAPPLTRTHTQD